jgi:hypothetical protein
MLLDTPYKISNAMLRLHCAGLSRQSCRTRFGIPCYRQNSFKSVALEGTKLSNWEILNIKVPRTREALLRGFLIGQALLAILSSHATGVAREQRELPAA